ncbi:putative chromatin remodeling & transcription regulator ABTB family [Rosa chinensis]|uniref:Putative chromatin remodeling & transcription regulator ABTB family n=1 Tax=Rosa chinensis TaxID=74649 RepID=A0A2P6RKC0_ROSCH|nr:BTB/POZ domain and ankyrin repeat-containing protein NPR1 [Rosa chinensis]PRQ46873.1 putative chromatin remodeling & transcription regulator ABTB family [Rosa chinensis]
MEYTKTCFSDSNEVVSSSISIAHHHSPSSSSPPPDITSLKHLSDNLELIVDSSYFADAKIVVGNGREVPVHRCILAARSSFFKNVFSAKEGSSSIRFELKKLAKEYDVGLDSLLAVLGYLYSGKLKSFTKGVCVCVDDSCAHVACRPVVDFMVEVLYASSTFQISELVTLYQRHLLDILENITIDDVLVVLYVANICGKACERLVGRCIEMIVKSDVDIVTLEKALPQGSVKRITDSRLALGLDSSRSSNAASNFPDKHTKRIHRALDSDDVELVRMLLKEGHTNLDDAHALHYAVAYCDAKTTAELLDLGSADVNCRNLRGYTVLHLAATRKDPKIIVSLLTKGARPSDVTLDGRKALQITKRLTRAADFFNSNDEGKSSSNDRLCIEILEQAEGRDPVLGEASLLLAMAGDDLRMKLLYLENRVGLARYLFPMEAKIVMDITQLDETSAFPLACLSLNNLAGSQTTTVDLNEAPFQIKEEHLARLRALYRSTEIGKRFFPRCSEVLNKIMDGDEVSWLTYTGNDTPEIRLSKRKRYMEIQEVLSKAFDEDKQEIDRSGMSSSSSSTSARVVRPKLTIDQHSKQT